MNDEVTPDSEVDPASDPAAQPTAEPTTDPPAEQTPESVPTVPADMAPTEIAHPATVRTVERTFTRSAQVPAEDDSASFTWGAFTTAALLAALTLGLFAFIVVQFAGVDETPVHQVSWSADDVEFDESAPLEFWYDHKNEKLMYRGTIDDAIRTELRSLTFKEDPSPGEKRSFQRSVDELAFKSSEQTFKLWYLMVITAIGGVLGVQARSISYFILHASSRNDLRMKQWWSWYYLRPLLGMIFGPLTVLLIKSEVIAKPDVAGGPLLTMFTVSILVGLIASLFFGKLVQTAQVLFGVDTNDSAVEFVHETSERRVDVSPRSTDKPKTDQHSDDQQSNDQPPDDQEPPAQEAPA